MTFNTLFHLLILTLKRNPMYTYNLGNTKETASCLLSVATSFLCLTDHCVRNAYTIRRIVILNQFSSIFYFWKFNINFVENVPICERFAHPPQDNYQWRFAYFKRVVSLIRLGHEKTNSFHTIMKIFFFFFIQTTTVFSTPSTSCF